MKLPHNKHRLSFIRLALLASLMLITGRAAAQGEPEPAPHVTVGGSVFGGGNLANVGGSSTVLVDQAGATIGEDVYGGGAKAHVNSSDGNTLTTGAVTTVTLANGTVTRNVYGGGLGQLAQDAVGTEGQEGYVPALPDVEAKVLGEVTVNIDGGTATNVFGCNYYLGAPQSTVTVNVTGGSVIYDVYGGGELADAPASPTVNISGGTVGRDVYGGGALADVDGSIVNVTGGTVTRNVYGGGLGRKEERDNEDNVTVTAVKAKVNGTVEVNIGILTGALDDDDFAPSASVTGSATIGGSVFGCNNTNGTPTDNVTVNIYSTARTDKQQATYKESDREYAIYQVFGGGNQANYEPTAQNKKATVHVWTCDNTIEYLYGGGNAADLGTTTYSSATDVIIDGGRIEWVFGGGNGYSATGNHSDPSSANYNPGANIKGNTGVTFHSGFVSYLFGGSNQWGNVTGSKSVNVAGDGPCTDNHITELYGGNNEAPSTGDIDFSMVCNLDSHTDVILVFGGSRNADIDGNVTLSIVGGAYDYVYGGNNIGGEITGNVTLNLNGGTIYEAAFGGNKGGGSIDGNITVNVEDLNLTCPLDVKDVFGAGDLATYTAPTGEGARVNNPMVYVKHLREGHPITGNVYGGGNGDPDNASQEPGMVTGDPKVIIGDVTEGHGSYTAAINGNVYGGGNAAKLVGSTSVLVQKANSTVGGDIYGGGNLATVSGSVDVQITDGTVSGDVYGGGALADVNVTNNALTTGATTSVILDGGAVHDIYGGGLGQVEREAVAAVGEEGQEGYVPAQPALSAVAAKVYGPVTVTVNGGSAHDVFGCNNANGAPQGTVQVNINTGGAVTNNVYGGGNLAAYTGTPDVNISGGTVSGSVFGGGNSAGVGGGNVEMTDGIVLTGLYGGCNLNGTVGGNILVSITGGTLGAAAVGTEGEEGYVAEQRANVHGGGYGNGTSTTGNVELTISQASGDNPPAAPVIYGDVYGGSAKGNVNGPSGNHTHVTLDHGTIHGDLYGGGLGDATYAALVYGAVQVTVNGGTVTGSVYGCNNVNGAPQSTVNVDIYGTDPAPSVDAYALGHVFGGGNQAAYTYGNGYPKVTVHNCNNSIEYVYGGGNAASVTSTDVTIYGGNTIGYVFAGGNGEGVASDFEMVSGDALAKIYGGTIGKVFGGNNSNGLITGSINVNINKQTESGHNSCPMKIGEVYGGGNFAAGKAGTITIGCTGDLVALGNGEHYGIDKEGIQYVYGGANQANISNDITLNIVSGIVENVFGGNNTSGSIIGSIQVNIDKNESVSTPCPDNWYVGDVYGGGNHADYDYTPAVNIKAGIVSGKVFGGGNDITRVGYGVGGGNVSMTGGTVLGGIYGGCNAKGVVRGDIEVNITGGTIGSYEKLNGVDNVTTDVFGGGYGKNTETTGNVEVNIGDVTISPAPTIYGDVYGGSALGQVNSADNTTEVNILNGTLETVTSSSGGFTVYNGGNVYGGGLGKKAVPDDPNEEGDQSEAAIAASVNGSVIVNIGAVTPNSVSLTDGDHTGNSYSGNATIKGNVYGGNNTYGSPQDNIVVNIYSTAHTDGTGGTVDNTVGGTAYAIANVFGGGNEADFRVLNKTATVNVWGCDNTIDRTFGGSNAAASNSVITDIKGGRINEVYAGGNGEVSAADIYGSVTIRIHGGSYNQSYGGSNSSGNITGPSSVIIDNAGCGNVDIVDHFMGGNDADRDRLENTIECTGSQRIRNLYAGCNKSNVAGDVILTVKGGTYDNVYGGSKGDLASLGPGHINKSADIGGNVVLNIYGGTILNAIFGGSHINGNIAGTITVNVEDKFDDVACELDVSRATVYGGGNQANYGDANHLKGDYPKVNIMNATVKAVYGGGLEAEVYGNPQVRLLNKAVILGDVYGGGNMGKVTGNPRVILNGKQTVY